MPYPLGHEGRLRKLVNFRRFVSLFRNELFKEMLNQQHFFINTRFYFISLSEKKAREMEKII